MNRFAVAAIGIEANRLWHRISGIDVSLESSYPRQIMCGIRTSSSCAARFASASLDELATSPLAKVIFDAGHHARECQGFFLFSLSDVMLICIKNYLELPLV